MRQIAINLIGGGKIYPCVTSHYHKAGVQDIISANRIPHLGIVVITDDTDSDKFNKRIVLHDTGE